MKNNHLLIIYIYLNYLEYSYNNIESKIEFQSINDGNIVNIQLFKREFAKFIKEKNINNNLVGDTLYFINIKYRYLELEIIKELFNQYSFRNIIMVNAEDLLIKNNTYAILTPTEMLLYNQNYIINIIDSENIKNTLKTLIDKQMIQKDIYVFQNDNQKLFTFLKNNNISLFYIYNPKNYLIDKLSKKVTNL